MIEPAYKHNGSVMFMRPCEDSGAHHWISSQMNRAIDKFWEKRGIDPKADNWSFNRNHQKNLIKKP